MPVFVINYFVLVLSGPYFYFMPIATYYHMAKAVHLSTEKFFIIPLVDHKIIPVIN